MNSLGIELGYDFFEVLSELSSEQISLFQIKYSVIGLNETMLFIDLGSPYIKPTFFSSAVAIEVAVFADLKLAEITKLYNGSDWIKLYGNQSTQILLKQQFLNCMQFINSSHTLNPILKHEPYISH